MRKVKILVVDDEKYSADFLAATIAKSTLPIETITTLYSGTKAVEFLKENKIDILLTDLNMPGLSGIDLIAKINEISPNVQVIVLTGFGTLEYATEVMKYGVKYFLQKPSTADQIYDSLEKAISNSKEKVQDALLNKKAIVEKAIRGQKIERDFSEKFSFLMFASGNHLTLTNRISDYLREQNVTYEIGGVGGIVIFLFFDNINVSQFVGENIVQSNDHLVLVFATNQTLGTIKKVFESGLRINNLAFYTSQTALIEITPSTQQDYQKLEQQFYMEMENFRNSLSRFIFLDAEKAMTTVFVLAKKAIIAPTTLKKEMSKSFEIVQAKLDWSNKEIFDFINHLNTAVTIVELAEIVQHTLSALTLAQGAIPVQNRISDNLNLIIERYYGNSCLSLKWISQNLLFLNAEYMGKTYVKETGEKFTNHLLDVRMHHAKVLLLDGKKIFEVAELVGLGDSPDYFGRVFKNYYGSTPKKFTQKKS